MSGKGKAGMEVEREGRERKGEGLRLEARES